MMQIISIGPLKHSLLPILHKTPNIHSFQWEEQDLSGKHFKVTLLSAMIFHK